MPKKEDSKKKERKRRNTWRGRRRCRRVIAALFAHHRGGARAAGRANGLLQCNDPARSDFEITFLRLQIKSSVGGVYKKDASLLRLDSSVHK